MTEKQCEICGAEISGAPQRIVIDRSTMEVCKSCARFGKPEDKWSLVPKKMVPVERAFTVSRPKPRDHFKDLIELVRISGARLRRHVRAWASHRRIWERGSKRR
jgi:putative transcription factor